MPGNSILSGRTDCRPEDVQYDPESLHRLDGFFKDLIDREKLQCASYLLSRHGKVFAHASMGFLKKQGAGDPFMPDSIRRIASITKLFTAIGIMQLVEDGKLYLYKSVSSFIKEFDTDQHRSITIEHLLSHTSGAVKPDPGAMAEAYSVPYFPVWPIETEEQKHECFKALLTGHSYNKPGKEWAYSSAGYIFLAEIISIVSGMPYFDYIRKNIFGPLGMDRTFFRVPDKLLPETCTIEGERGPDPSDGDTMPVYLQPFRGGGGIFSTLGDLWKFAQAVLNGGQLNSKRILGEHTLNIMTTNRLAPGVTSVCWGQNLKDVTYGLGFGFDNQGLPSNASYGHEGAGRSRLMIDPVEKLIAVYFAPSPVDWLPESIRMPPQIIWSGLE